MATTTPIKSLISKGKLPEALAAYDHFFNDCREARNELIQSQSQYAELQQKQLNSIIGEEAAGLELNRIRYNLLVQLDQFHQQIIASYFEIDGLEQYTDRNELLQRITESRLRAKQFELKEQLAEGSSSAIYQLASLTTDRQAICMVLKSAVIPDYALAVIKSLASLRHRNVIKLIDQDLTAYPFFLILDYVHGPTLNEAVAKTGPRPAAQVADWLYQLTDATEYLRQKGLAHVTLIPSKIYVDDEWQLLLSPFDLFFTFNGKYTLKRYMDICRYGSPEFVEKDGKPGRDFNRCFSDQYSIGLVAYKMLTGEDLFTGDSVYDILQLRRKFARNAAFRQDLLDRMPAEGLVQFDGSTKTLTEVIHQLLSQDPGARFASFNQLLRVLHPFARADNPAVGPARKSYRRSMALNKEFIRDFYLNFQEQFPPARSIFDPIRLNRQSAMLQMAIDLLLDLEKKKGLLLSLLNDRNHRTFDTTSFAAFFESLLFTLKDNDPFWDEAAEAEWLAIRDQVLELVAQRDAVPGPVVE